MARIRTAEGITALGPRDQVTAMKNRDGSKKLESARDKVIVCTYPANKWIGEKTADNRIVIKDHAKGSCKFDFPRKLISSVNLFMDCVNGMEKPCG
jgi:hypothetical protein